ncbi:MAG: Rpn family recombination-promoting nuclease/putative transposase [Methylococcaceae bacterium]|nr:Rpn family recombination-promoting nuclease/putative transposase [Methylococcaceae bacterium]
MTDKSLGTFINPFTDFGFKKIFGSEESKPLLISFLNDLLPIEDKIVSLEFKNIEKLGILEEDRRAIFDIYCHDEKDHQFIVELQRAKQQHFQDRAAYYSSFLIQDQAKKGKWDFELTPIYFIGILDFSLTNFNDDNYLHFGQITDIYTQKVMYEKLNFIYIEMSKFKKQESELANHLEWWLYFLRELVSFNEIPSEFEGDIIEDAFNLAKLANMNYEDRHAYELSLKYYRDFVNVLDTAKKDGREEGIEQEREQIAVKMLQKNTDINFIAEITGLSIERLEQLK